MANFDDDGDAEVTWDEFRDALKNIAGQKKIQVQNETECLSYSTNETSAL